MPYRNDVDGRADGGPWETRDLAQIGVEEFDLGGRDLVVAGAGASRRLIDEALALGVPVVAEAHSSCRVPGTITTAHHLLSAELEELRPGRIVVLGRAGLSRPLSLLFRRVPTVVVRPAGGDPARKQLAMTDVTEFVSGGVDDGWGTAWLAAEQAARSIVDSELESDPRLTEPRVARDVWCAVPEGSLLVVGSSMPVRDLDWFAPTRPDLQVVSNRGASGIDGFLSLALGAASGHQPAFGLVGDLSFLHDSNGFLSMPRPNLTVVVVNNNGGGIFSFLPQAGYPENFERVFGTPAPVNLETLVRAYSAEHQLIDSPETLSGALRRPPQGVTILEVRTDRQENVAVHRRVTKAVVDGFAATRGQKASPPA